MGLGDFIEEAEKAATGQGGQDGDNNANNANGSNDKTIDTMVDSAVDELAGKEGLSAAFDPEVNSLINEEVNKVV